MIREDRELLAELARLNTAMPSLALRIMGASATASEQRHYAERLIAAGEGLERRAEGIGSSFIEGEVVGESLTALPFSTVDPDWQP